ncbi:MAG: type II secretion system protein [Synergistaceae bacterium]|nr:type II secretion system protein [Synergistaceae bacterium]
MKRKGFTLVELLIVIVVIGVLSTMMMLSSTEAVSSAKAATIISNLRNLKTATLAWYADNLDRVVKDSNGYQINTNGTKQKIDNFARDHADEILKYLNAENSIKLKNPESNKGTVGAYVLHDVDQKKGIWLAGYKLFNDTKDADTRLVEKLAARASAVGLKNQNNVEYTWTKNGDTDKYVYINILNLSE